ncbi:MAG: hypothetical protein R3D05_02145 [Dongiaceae bacterium]
MGWNRVTTCILLALVLMLGGCTAKTVPQQATQSVQSVGIISAIGDDLAYQGLPEYMWQPIDAYRKDVTVWKIDSFIAEQLSRTLQPKYKIVPVDFDRDAFLDPKLYQTVLSAGTAPNAGPIGEIVRATVRNPEADLFLVVLRGRVSFGVTRYFAEGIGVLRTQPPKVSRSYYHAVYRIAVVDGHSFKPLAILDGVNDETHPFAGLFHGSPFAEFPAQYWAADRGQVTVDQIAWIMEGMKGLFARTLPVTLRRLHLLEP